MTIRGFRLGVFALVFLGVLPATTPFNSGSTGTDGALNFTTPGAIDFDPAALGLNPAGDNIFNFTTINIGPGVTVNMRASKLREKSVVWLATGAVTIAGTLNLSGASGYPEGSAGANLRVPAEPGPGGYPGGVGQTSSSPAQPGAGPGGIIHNHGSYATGPVPYGNSLLVPLRGGSGGAGEDGDSLGAGGGAGGGAIQIASSVSITVSGSILANGGGQGYYFGSGGAIHLEAPLIGGGGSLQATGFALSVGAGWIRMDSTTNTFSGTSQPAANRGPLFTVPLPSAVPTVSIVSINGVAVPSIPTGSFSAPDVTINNGAAVPVAIAASNIPVGTVVKLLISSDTGADQVVQASALAGTVANSTATANIVWPLGVSRVFIRATW